MSLKHTNISSLVGIDLEYLGFSYGGPLNRAALADEVDVLLTADQPALVLLSKSDRFEIVARMMYNRVCLYVPLESPIKKLADLRGKTVMGPVGAAAERVAFAAIENAGINSKQVSTGSLDMAQQAALLKRAGSNKKWPGVDALYGFDPLPAVFELNGQTRVLYCGRVVSSVLASREMIEQRRQELVSFLRGFALAWHFYTQNSQLANHWFSQESRLGVSDAVLEKCASVEPNRRAERISDLRLSFNDEDLETMAVALAFLNERKIIRGPLDFRRRIVSEPLMDALDDIDLEKLFQEVRPSTNE